MSETKEALFSAKNKKNFTDPLIDANPIAVLMLGVCSALAVTSQLVPSIIMAVSVIFVLGASNVIISIIRKQVPEKIRIIVELLIIATLVILVDEVLKAYAFEMSKKLSVFVGLIITNCIVMGRAEAFALHNKPWASLLDGLGNGLGYGIILIIVGFSRELFGQGTLLGMTIIPESIYNAGYVDNGLMVLPPAAFIILGFIVWGQRQYTKKFEDN